MSENPRKKEPAEPPEAEAAPSEPAQAEPVEASIEEQLAAVKEEARKYLGNWQRAEADFQNYKRRVEQERSENRRFASVALIINTLPILDDLERALVSVDTRLAGLTWFDGLRLIHRKLQLILENAGVTVIEAEGRQFDPHEHEAVTHAEGEEGLVIAEIQRGYKLYDRVLRPAMVVVGKPSGPSGGKEEGPEEEGQGKKEDEKKEEEGGGESPAT